LRTTITIAIIVICCASHAQHQSFIGNGWASNSINTVVFRKNSIVSYKQYQFAAYYDSLGNVVLAKRKLSTDKWEIKTTNKKGNIKDAHNSISIMVDGNGYLHISWDHHGNQLRYCKSIAPLSLELNDNESMTSLNEKSVSYPEFYKFNNGNLLFLYRDGASGKGNLVINKYSLKERKWKQLQSNLIDGESKRNAYWQACIDSKDAIHISWVWRESPDVSSNHDMNYAKSEDGGITWKKSNNEVYSLPINIANAEIAWAIPQKSELINQTSMVVDDNGNPLIATYFKISPSYIPQYQLICLDKGKWYCSTVSNRTTAFSLSGAGTKKIPIARPQVLVYKNYIGLLFRDEAMGNRASLHCIKLDFSCDQLQVKDLSNESLGQWEPSFDTELWKQKKKLHLFTQYTAQGDGEKTISTKTQPINIIEYSAKNLFSL
jgi:hypothetical protein